MSTIQLPLSPSERLALKRMVDEAARARAARINSIERRWMCTGCEGNKNDWTLGCSSCYYRHYGRARVGKYAHGRKWYDDMLIAHNEWMRQHHPKQVWNGGGGRGKRPSYIPRSAQGRFT